MKKTLFSAFILIVCMLQSVNAQIAQVDTFLTKSGKQIVITPVKHASMRMQYNGLEIEIDPVISMAPSADFYSKLPKADIILITHEHGDHLDKEAVKQLEKTSTVIVTNPNSAKILGKGEVMKNGDEKKLPSMTIEAVPAYNTSADKQQFHPKGRDNGYIVTIDGLRIYIAGDTEDIPEMKDVKNIDVAFLPCNLPYTMTPEQVSNAARTFMPKVLFPYHYGQTKIEQVTELLKGSGIDVRIRNYQ